MTAPETLAAGHVPVMLAEVIESLAIRDGAIYVDGTFGAGGYARGMLESADCRVVGIDRDPDAIAEGASLAERHGRRLTLHQGRFGNMDTILAGDGLDAVDGVALDLGVSSMQLDRAARGFSFRADAPLDMRMEQAGPSAADLVNELEEAALAHIIWRYGEEHRSRRIAKAIVASRRGKPVATTGELAEIVRRAVGGGGGRIDPATKTFQALRIAVNDEIGELERGLAAAERVLRPGGRLAVVSFHSLEDRPVKEFLRARSGRAERGSRYLPEAPAAPAPSFRLLHGGVRKPDAAESERNPRARSARLRAAERTEAPAWEAGAALGDH